MKIKYKALWIEDNFADIEAAIRILQKKFNEDGFIFDIERKSGINLEHIAALQSKLAGYNPYDIILFDFDLGEDSISGDQIASHLRASVFTDMIFYSGSSTDRLRKLLFDSKVDGVYIANRTNLVEETWPIFEDSIKRVFDLNNMRGVLLDEMSNADMLMREKLVNVVKRLSHKEFLAVLGKYVEHLEKRQKEITDHKNSVKEIESLLGALVDPRLTEFDFIRRRLWALTKDDIFKDGKQIHRNQMLRNKFAHSIAKLDEETGKMGLDRHQETYGHKEFANIRKDLIQLITSLSASL